MDFLEKAKIRLEHWVDHSEHHIEEYNDFADELEQAGKSESAEHIREMTKLNQKSNECLKRALEALK
jgi:predicted patatin/cPLA2 family phospholipase